MILRIWHGFTKAKDADEYDRMLRMEILPGIHRIEGYAGRGCCGGRRARKWSSSPSRPGTPGRRSNDSPARDGRPR